jgi:hypothetical protein
MMHGETETVIKSESQIELETRSERTSSYICIRALFAQRVPDSFGRPGIQGLNSRSFHIMAKLTQRAASTAVSWP